METPRVRKDGTKSRRSWKLGVSAVAITAAMSLASCAPEDEGTTSGGTAMDTTGGTTMSTTGGTTMSTAGGTTMGTTGGTTMDTTGGTTMSGTTMGETTN